MGTVYLNGQYLPIEQATISVLDRGFLFSDALYEVIAIYRMTAIDTEIHLARLNAGLAAIGIHPPLTSEQWQNIFYQLLIKNPHAAHVGSLYIQVTRGSQPQRHHPIPEIYTPTVLVLCERSNPPDASVLARGFSAITLDDNRRADCSYKACGLLPNILAHQQALNAHAEQAIYMRNGFAIEGTSSNLMIIHQGCLITPPEQPGMLMGVTRQIFLDIARSNGIPTQEMNISAEMLLQASEVFLTGSIKEMYPVVRINDQAIGDEKPGPYWHRLMALYQAHKASQVQTNPKASAL